MEKTRPLPWKLIFVLVALPFLWPLARDAYAAADAFFAGRSIRMSRTNNTSRCTSSAHSCMQFDDATNNGLSRPRYWDGAALTQFVVTPDPSPSPGAILIGNGTRWIQLGPGTNGQQLTLSGGVPVWAAP